jgi:hypothetical protein
MGQAPSAGRSFFDQADFVLSVTAIDFDLDGDMDVASASFFDGTIRWYENLDGAGTSWKNHTLYVGLQGHYVSTADLDDDGDQGASYHHTATLPPLSCEGLVDVCAIVCLDTQTSLQ